MTMRYREVPLLLQNVVRSKRKVINVFAGGYHAILMDSKTSEISGGYQFDNYSEKLQFPNRFIYWRTFREAIFLTETCLDRNDVCHELKIVFEGCPILSVECFKESNYAAVMIIVTTTSIHRVPLELSAGPGYDMQIEQDSMLLKVDESVISDSLHCYTFISDIGQAFPIAATAVHYADKMCSKIAIASAQSLHLLTMRIEDHKLNVDCLELDHNPLIFSKFIHTIADSWRRKTHTSQVVAMSFGSPTATENVSFLYSLHRDGALRVWLSCGRLLSTEYLSKYTQGSETEFHTCILRCSELHVALYFSFQTFSEFIILRPEVSVDAGTGIASSVVLNTVCTILAPNYDLIDFKLCDQYLWSLWCNAKGETQTLAYELTATSGFGMRENVWLPVILENTYDKDLSTPEDGTDLKDMYCNRILQSGLFPDKVIRKTLTMFNRNLVGIAGSSTAGSMMRLKRYVFACIESQLQHECANIRQKGQLDDEQMLEISNSLWEKFYLYCIQYRYESSRPIGLFLFGAQNIETPCTTVGIVRKKYVSFFRACDELEVGFFAPSPHEQPISLDEDPLKDTVEMQLLVSFLGEMEQTLSTEQKHELDSYIHQYREDGSGDEYLTFIGVTQNQLIIHNLLPAFLQRIADLPRAIEQLLQYLNPVNKEEYLSSWNEQPFATVKSVKSGRELSCELALTTAKQTIHLRYMLLRNLVLLLQFILRHSNLHYDIVDVIQSVLRPNAEIMLRCYHVMNWIAQTRLDIDWTKTNKISASFPANMRTSMTLLQAYATSRMNDEISCYIKSLPATASIQSDISLTLEQKTDLIISYICPSSDDFLFGEWLSNSDLHVHIDEYVRLLSNWCEWNSCSRNFIKVKSCLMLGDTYKALDLFPLSLKGVQSERYLQKILHQNEKLHDTCQNVTLTTFYLRLIRLFEAYGAYDGVIKLVHSGIDGAIIPNQQAMFQSIEFTCHIELGRYEEAYNTLTKNCDPARKKDCLRQLICLLFSVRRLDVLLDLPYYGLDEEFTNIVCMNARSADVSECIQYHVLYSFYVNKMNQRKAANIAYEEGMRNFLECNSVNHLQRYYQCLAKCLNSLAIIKPSYRWILQPIIERVEPPTYKMGEDKIEIIDMKELEKKLITTHCALQLSLDGDEFKLVTSVEPTNLISLLLKRKLYHLAIKLAHICTPSMVSKVYEHLTNACISASSNITMANVPADSTNSGISWLNENCVSDVAVLADNASTAWNYLQYMIKMEADESAVDAHLAVLNRCLSRNAYIPTWLENWCFKNVPIKLIRAYLCYGRLEDAYEQTIGLFRNRFFSSGRFNHNALFPLTVCEYLLYELEQSSKYNKQKEQIEQYLHIIEVAF